MKFFNKLKAYKEEEAKESIIGFGIIRAMDYDSGKKGHLILVSVNTKCLWFLKKAFIPL